MSATDMTPRDALMRLGASTAEAIAQVLEMFAPDTIERGDVTVLSEGQSPFNGIMAGSVAASVSYVDGVTGANIFVLTAAGVRNMAQAMGMPAPDDGESADLSELELSAVGEASNQMMAAAASAIGVVLGQEIAISVPDIRVLDDPDKAEEIYGTSPAATSTTFLIGGESCRLIQLVPRAFVVRMARALDELDSEQSDDDLLGGETAERGGASVALVEALSGIKVRVWAELGRTQLGLSRALGLPLGAVVELDHAADAPVDLFVNGLRFAQGHLIVTDDGEWAFQCDSVGGRAIPDAFVADSPVTEICEEITEPAIDQASEAVDAAPTDDTPDVIDAESAAGATAAVAAETGAETEETPEAAPADTPAALDTPNQEGAVD